MKKVLIVLLLVCLAVTGCSKKANNANAKWDCVEYDSIEDMNTAAGTNIVSASVAGKSEEWFGVISKSIAQYKFKVNDEEWCIRASKDVDNDISGLHYDNIGFEKDTTATYYNDEVYAFRFFDKGVQYVISLDVKDKDISTGHFDEICNDFKTNITGVKSGYENELLEEGNDVILRTTMFNDDGTTTIMDTIYTFENDKLVKITSKLGFETEQAAKDYLDAMTKEGADVSSFVLEGSTITSDSSSNVDFYSDYTKATFIDMMKSSVGQ